MFTSKPSIDKHEKNLARAGAYDDLKKIQKIRSKYFGISFLMFALGLVLFFPLHMLLFGGISFSGRMDFVSGYFIDFIAMLTPGSEISGVAWFKSYFGWYFQNVYYGIMSFIDASYPAGISPWKTAIVLGSWVIGVSVPLLLITAKTEGLDTTPNIFGDTRWADERDINNMSNSDLVGFDGKLFLVGKLKGKFIRMKETLSVLLLAPPGTGKTVAFIVPSTVLMDTCCQMLNDQKPELFFMTSGHRSTLGPVFQIMWSAQDMPAGGWMTEEQVALISPDLIDLDENGELIRDLSGAIKVKPIFYPSWNPIGSSSIPSAGPKRDLYIERLASVLAPDPSGGGDKFWTSKARGALIGMVHYLVAKVELGQSDIFPGFNEDGIPVFWRGKECSFPLLVDWFTDAQNQVEDSEGDDPMRELFKRALQECRDIDKAYTERFGSPIMNRALSELTGLMNSPDKTRGSILTTLDEALSPFKNEAVRQRTSSSSFSFNELRGSPLPEPFEREDKKRRDASAKGDVYHPRYKRDEWAPITIYISVNAEDAKAFATITGIFIDSANAYLVANGPNAIDDRGNQLGPHDFFMMLDETPTLPKLSTVIDGPAVGRSKRVSYAIVGQDFAQIETRYSKPEVETMKSTTAMKVVLSQNNDSAARAITEMAGSMTYLKAGYGMKEYGDPITKFFDMKKEIITGTNWEKRSFIDTSFVMSMPANKHIVLVQNYMNRPILADTPKFFQEPELLARVFNMRTGQGPKPALPMPKSMMAAASANGEKNKIAAQSAAEMDKAKNNPIVAVVATPQNISDISRDLTKDDTVNRNPVGNEYAIYHVELTEDQEYLAPPTDDTTTVTSDPKIIAELLKDRRVFVFDEEDKESVRNIVKEEIQIGNELFKTAKDTILFIDEEVDGDIFTLGYQGATHCSLPRSADEVTPSYSLRWLTCMVTVAHYYKLTLKNMEMGQ